MQFAGHHGEQVLLHTGVTVAICQDSVANLNGSGARAQPPPDLDMTTPARQHDLAQRGDIEPVDMRTLVAFRRIGRDDRGRLQESLHLVVYLFAVWAKRLSD